jgi:hypothetical protein
VHAVDVDAHPVDDAPAHVAPRQVFVLVLGVHAHGADQPRAPVLLQRKDGEKIARVQCGVQLAVHCRAARFDVGDVEEMIVCAAPETDRRRLAHRRMCAIAAGDVGRFTRLGGSVCPRESGQHTTGRVLECHQLSLSLDVDVGLGQAIDQQTLVFVLGKDQRIRKRTDGGAHVAQDGVRHRLAGRPQIDGSHRPPTGDDGVSEADLAVQFERACLHRQGARRRSRFRRLVDDSHAQAQPGQPQGQHQARRSCPHDEDVGIADQRQTAPLTSNESAAKPLLSAMDSGSRPSCIMRAWSGAPAAAQVRAAKIRGLTLRPEAACRFRRPSFDNT